METVAVQIGTSWSLVGDGVSAIAFDIEQASSVHVHISAVRSTPATSAAFFKVVSHSNDFDFALNLGSIHYIYARKQDDGVSGATITVLA